MSYRAVLLHYRVVFAKMNLTAVPDHKIFIDVLYPRNPQKEKAYYYGNRKGQRSEVCV